MLYLYDNAIAQDLLDSFNPDVVTSPMVRVIDAANSVGVAAQLQDDHIRFPLIALFRNQDTPIDTERINFSRVHFGVATEFDTVSNNMYYEKALPIQLSYDMTVLTTNTVDMDEIIRELVFKYINMYFLTIQLPYESKRKIRFGVILNSDGIQRSSGTAEYLSSGQLYQTILPLRVEGAVLISNTPVHLRRMDTQTYVLPPSANDVCKP